MSSWVAGWSADRGAARPGERFREPHGAVERQTCVLLIPMTAMAAVALGLVAWLLSGCTLDVRGGDVVRASASPGSGDGASGSDRPAPRRAATRAHPDR